MLINREVSFASGSAHSYRLAPEGVSATKSGASMRIAVLEDDPSQSELLSYWLRLAGHQPRQFARGVDLVVTAQTQTFDVLLLDWNVPGLSGMDVVERVRQRLKSAVPILFVTARSDEQDVVAALREGADDYIARYGGECVCGKVQMKDPYFNYEERNSLGRKYYVTYFAKNFKEILQQCERHGVEHRTPMNQTPLMAAAAAGNVLLAEALLARGADPDAIETIWGEMRCTGP